MSIIIMILLLQLLVLVHEAGHFLAARAFKIKVSKFRIWFYQLDQPCGVKKSVM